ncbi:MAG: dUTP pyrophosphatase [Oscillospiraceae bacterium]|nr:dUTP pyrophosphatase [Oscillospiraceae bacterium]
MHKIIFAKLREGAIIPTKRDEDSDYDLYACFDEEEFVIPAFSTRLVPTGIISAFDENLGVKFEERGSNTKWCGIVQAGVIDSGYRGEWFCAIYNGNALPVHISKNVSDVQRLEDRVMVPYSKAVCQFNVREIPKVEIQEVSPEAVLACKSLRGAGALGSSGK